MRQTVVFDFNSEPMLCQQLCADAVAVTDVDKLAADLVLSEGGRWDLAAMTLVKFTPKSVSVVPKHTLFKVLYFILAKFKNYTLFILFSLKYFENTLL